MRALGFAALLVILFVSGIIVWALGVGSPMSGEPVAVMQVMQGSNGVLPAKAGIKNNSADLVRKKQLTSSAKEPNSATEVLLNVAADTPDVVATKERDGLAEQSKYGLLPVRASDGRFVATAYAKAEKIKGITPRIAILFTGLGLDHPLTHHAIQTLPKQVSLAFSPYGRNLEQHIKKARLDEHELLLQLPLEPNDYPDNDTGPKTLLASYDMTKNRPRLNWSLGRFTGYFAVVNTKGSRFFTNRNAVSGLFRELDQRGLYFFRDNRGARDDIQQIAEKSGIGYAHAHLQIDHVPNRTGIHGALARLEKRAKRSGLAIGVARMHPISIDMIAQWVRGLEKKGFHLTPLSSVYRHNNRKKQ